MKGMKAAASLTGAGRVVLALKAKYKDAIMVIEDFKAKKAHGFACRRAMFRCTGSKRTVLILKYLSSGIFIRPEMSRCLFMK